MSFDVYLKRFEAGKSAQVSREPVLAVLKTAKYTNPHNCYVVEFPDGADVEFSASELEGSGDFADGAFFIHGKSLHLTKFIFEIARAGDMVRLAAMEPFVPILTRAEQRQQLPAELAGNDPEPVICRSPEELDSLLSGGYEAWQNYRDRVFRRNGGV